MEYHTKHTAVLNYIMQLLYSDESSSSNPEMDGKSLITDFDLKIPHIAHILYMVIRTKGLDLNKALSFISMGMDKNGNPIRVDNPLVASIGVIHDITSKFEELSNVKDDFREFSTMALSTFPGRSKMTDYPINEALAQVIILRAYINALIKYCTDKSSEAVPTTPVANNKPPTHEKQPSPPPINSNKTQKERHGFVTAWLVLVLVVNALGTVINFKAAFELYYDTNTSVKNIILLGLFSIMNVMFAALLLQHKKNGFWGIAGTSVAIFMVNLYNGTDVLYAMFGFLALAILYGILQITKNGVSAWENLE
ncbi:MAG TPA: hypothetical protein PK239_10390 [Chitinophagales bacterium]|nr:hypothetical protein [Chitinophagales bacterium]HRK27684.1 hypothetical protein [Chitinophagales bacterium]